MYFFCIGRTCIWMWSCVCVCSHVNRFKPEINVGCLSQPLLTISFCLFDSLTAPRTHRLTWVASKLRGSSCVTSQCGDFRHTSPTWLFLHVGPWNLNLDTHALTVHALLTEASPQCNASGGSTTSVFVDISGCFLNIISPC